MVEVQRSLVKSKMHTFGIGARCCVRVATLTSKGQVALICRNTFGFFERMCGQCIFYSIPAMNAAIRGSVVWCTRSGRLNKVEVCLEGKNGGMHGRYSSDQVGVSRYKSIDAVEDVTVDAVID